jgi:hypothetical protein
MNQDEFLRVAATSTSQTERGPWEQEPLDPSDEYDEEYENHEDDDLDVALFV